MVLARPSLYVGTIECYLKGNFYVIGIPGFEL